MKKVFNNFILLAKVLTLRYTALNGGDLVSEKKVRKRTTSTQVRNRWNAKHYDRINITIPKGYGDIFKDFCEENGTSMNGVLMACIDMDMERWRKKNAEKNS